MTTLDDEAMPPDDSPRPEKALDESSRSTEAEEEATPAVEFRHVHLSFGEKRVLDDISFALSKGEIKIILSGSGGGKSTILKLIPGLLKPDAGQIFVDGEEISRLAEEEMQGVRDRTGMVFQEGALFDSLS